MAAKRKTLGVLLAITSVCAPDIAFAALATAPAISARYQEAASATPHPLHAIAPGDDDANLKTRVRGFDVADYDRVGIDHVVNYGLHLEKPLLVWRDASRSPLVPGEGSTFDAGTQTLPGPAFNPRASEMAGAQALMFTGLLMYPPTSVPTALFLISTSTPSSTWLLPIGLAGARAPAGTTLTRFAAGGEITSFGKVVGTGIVDLGPTLEGIQGGTIAPRAIFQNLEGRLPARGSGYYEEFVVPTVGVRGVGPQRIVRGAGGEFYYTPDHYQSFIPLNGF